MSDIKNKIALIKELKDTSTKVVSWYANGDTVRGPFCRWLEVTEVQPEYKQHVAPAYKDAEYATACMNWAPDLINHIELLNKEIEKLKTELEIDKILRE